MTQNPPLPANVATAFDSFPVAARDTLLAVRRLIFQTAASNPLVGTLTETLKWGQPAYLTEASKSGSTIRLGEQQNNGVIYLNCKTTLVETMREIYPDTFTYQGSRAVLFASDQPLPNDALAHCIEMALTYHKTKNTINKR